MILNCAIIDDEPLAADLLETYVRKTPTLQLIGKYHSALDAMKPIKENKVDLVFLDIQMPELSGLEFSKILDKKTKVVFTTAFKEYAVESFKANALDYLLKPISYEDFLNSVDKALEYFTANIERSTINNDRFIFVKSEYKLVKINFSDITYIEGVKDYVKIHLTDSRPAIMSLINMKRLEEKLPRPEFTRVHRSFIVHMDKVDSVDRAHFIIEDAQIPISESYKLGVQEYLSNHTLA